MYDTNPTLHLNLSGHLFDDDVEQPMLIPTEPSEEVVYLTQLNSAENYPGVEPPMLIPVMEF